ncbi:MAG: Ig-like domain-containing protein [Clostridia bacterium]
MKKILALLLTIALLLPSLTTVFAESVAQVIGPRTLTDEKAETESLETKTVTGEKRNVEFKKAKDALELFGFSSYYNGGHSETWYGFVRFMSNSPETVEFLNDYYNYSFVAGDYVPNAHAFFAVRSKANVFSLVRVDETTYAETEIKVYGEEFYFMDMAFDIASDVMYGINGTSLYSVDLNTGDYTEVGETGIEDNLFTLACSSEGVLYTISKNGALYTLDNATGASTFVGYTDVVVNYLQSMTWDHINGGLYWANCNETDGILYSVDPATAVATPIGNIYDSNMEVTCLSTKSEFTGDPVSVTGINLVPATATLKQNKTLSLIAQVLPWDATERGVSFTSSNPNIATVDQNGVVTAISYGETTITATTTDGNFSSESIITVPDTSALDAAFNAAINAPGGTYNFVNDDIYPWEIVTLGERTAVRSTNVGIEDSHAFITLSDITMYRGNTISFDWFTSCERKCDGIIFLINGNKIDLFSAISSDFSNYVYNITETGTYTFSWVYAKDGDGSAGEDVGYIDNVALDTTPPGPVTGVTLTPETIDIVQTQTAQLTATVLPVTAADILVSFISSDPTVATVDETGFVSALTAGTAIITVTTHDGSFTASSTVNVISITDLIAQINEALNIPSGTLSFDMDMVNMWMPDAVSFPERNVAHSTTNGIKNSSTSITLTTTTYGMQVIMFDWMVSSEQHYDKATFSIDGVEQAQISGTTMTDFESVVCNAGSAGQHTYTWTYLKDESGDKGADMLWVDNVNLIANPEPQSVNLRTTARVHKDQTINLIASVVPTYATDTTLTYTTSNASKVTVDSNGFITGVSEGTATVTATAVNGVFAECVITVFDTAPEPDGMLYCFPVYPDGVTVGLVGLVKLDYNSGFAELIQEHPTDIFAAEYYNGVIYAYDDMLRAFLTFDAITGELLSAFPVSEIAYDMTYDYTTDTMYALYGNGTARGLATVNMTTGALNHINGMPEESLILTLACDNMGKLYGVAMESGILYEIKKETAECIAIGDTGITGVNFVQSMTYSYEMNTLYWASYPDKNLYSVDRNTGATSLVMEDPIGEVCGLMAFNNAYVLPSPPAAVTGVSVNPSEIALPWGETARIRSVIEPANATNKKVTWASENEEIVTVDRKGNILGIGTGIATVTATTVDGGFVAHCEVTVGNCPYPVLEPGKAMIKLTVSEVWGDGTGYQMLLDSTHSLFGTTIPQYGPLTYDGDAPQEIYNQFDYKIPENADGRLTTQNIVINDSVYIIVDAGIYDFCITNPVPGECMYIANNGNGSFGTGDDFVVEEGYMYEFSIDLVGLQDFTSLSYAYIGTSGETTYDPGDANLDGLVNTGDAAFVLRSLIGLETLSDAGRAVADVNNDGLVNTGDAALILEMCLNN